MSVNESMNRSISILLACVFALCAAEAFAETISPDHWVYEALRSFELRGLVALEPTLPYTRDRIEAYVAEISRRAESERIELGARQRFLLERLEKEFAGKAERPEERDDRPVLTIRDGGRFAAVDVSAGGAALKRVDRERGEANGLGEIGVLVGLGRGVAMETRGRLVMAPEWGSNVDGGHPSPRTRSFRGLSGEIDRTLLSANGGWWELRFGREYVQWGGRGEEGLILSRTAGSLDHVGGRIALGRFALSGFHSVLGPDLHRPFLERYLAGHRITVALPGGVYFGVAETVLYGGPGMEWAYLMPLGVFYVSQANERDNNDNILFALDVKAPLRRGLELGAELLVDDIQYERGDGSGPDRIAFTIGLDGQIVAGGREYGLSGRYTFIDIYTYEHAYSLSGWEVDTDYVGGDGLYPWYALLGSPLGPDADRWDFTATCGAGRRIDLRVDAAFIRRGEGNDLDPWFPGLDSDPPFPSGDVLRETWLSAGCSYDLGKGSRIAAHGGARFLRGGPEDIEAVDGFGRLEIVLDP